MSLSKIAAIGTVGAASLIGIYYGSNTVAEGVTLRETGEYSTQTDKFGYQFASFFLTTEEGKNIETWKLKNSLISSADNDGFFKDSNSTKKAQEVCKEKYGIDTKTGIQNDDLNKWLEVWKFCSLGTAKPQTIEESKNSLKEGGKEKEYTKENGNNKWGKELKSKVISIENEINKWFWEIRNQEWKNGNLPSAENEKFFSNQKSKNIKDICKAAYDKDKSEESSVDNPIETEIVKYCSIEINTQ